MTTARLRDAVGVEAAPDLAGQPHQSYAPGFHHFAFAADGLKFESVHMPPPE